MIKSKERVVIIFSGGLDSTTTLYYALNKGYKVDAVTFEYGQKHHIELKCAKNIISQLDDTSHLIIPLDTHLFKNSSLTGRGVIPKNREDITDKIIPTTYVPARNLIFLSIASAYAESNNINQIFIGINSQDYSGYPDCRLDFIKSFESTVNLATKSGREGKPFKVQTPLINLTKKEIILLANEFQVPLEKTWSCYDPIYVDDNEFQPCLQCDSCLLRQKGFTEAGLPDPAARHL